VGGEVRVAAGQQMHLTDTSVQANPGGIEVIGNDTQLAEIEFDGRLTNAAFTRNIAASHATLRFNGGLPNHGAVGISVGTSHVHGDINNKPGATITVKGNSTVTFWDNLTNNDTVEVSSGSTAIYFETVTGVASFTGGGTTVVEGSLAPGNSPGAMNFAGDVVVGSLAEVEIELGGVIPGAQHDRLTITGAVNLEGTLDLVPLAPYTDPAARGTAGDFTIITAGARNGTFSTVQYDGSTRAPDVETDGGGSFRDHVAGGLFRSMTYTSTAVIVQNLLASEGDTDGDLDVDTVDLTGMIMNYT